MPLKWFLDNEGNKLLISDCLEKGLLSNEYPLSYLAVCADQREWNGKPSTTQLISGTRCEYLKLFTPYAENPAEQAFRILGTKSHKKLEDLTPEGSLSEFKCSDDEISGIADLLEKQPNGEWWLTDYKTWGSYKVMLGIGLKAKKRPAFREDGKPVLYVKSGKWGKAGEQKTETYYEPDPKFVDMYEVELQLNRYRIITEKNYNIKISKLKTFAIVRDGGCISAINRGVDKNTYYIDVKILDDNLVNNYFTKKREALLYSVEGYIKDENETWADGRSGEYPEEGFDFDLIKKHAPQLCTNKETWNGRKCEKFCPVKEICDRISYAKN